MVGRYELCDLLGAGETTTTWKGFDPALHRDVVVKLLHPHLLSTNAARRMEREGRALARLDHPAIPSVIEIVQQPGVLALVEEYVAGESLAHTLAKRGALSLTETLAIIRPVASALDHAHQHSIVHRNVAPDNILVTFVTFGDEQRVYLLDLGLVAFYDDESLKALTPHGKMLGDPANVSPEQIRGKRGDHRSDVYSLGIVLYETLTGENPFDTGIPHSTQFRQVNEEPPERPLAGLPRPVQAVIRKALRKAPDRRYQSAGELAEALAKAAGAQAAGSLVQADPSRDQVIATIHANQVLLVHHRQPADDVPLIPAVTDVDVSRVLDKDKEACALQVYAFDEGRVVRDECEIPASNWNGAQKREMLRDMYVEALLEMGQCHAGRKEYEEAIRWYRRALEANELREDVHRGIMRCYFEAGRRPEAIAQYYCCEEILERELNLGPLPETVRLYEQIVGKGKS